jgi:hypothetical protein
MGREEKEDGNPLRFLPQASSFTPQALLILRENE